MLGVVVWCSRVTRVWLLSFLCFIEILLQILQHSLSMYKRNFIIIVQ